jgi:hypothetical protein
MLTWYIPSLASSLYTGSVALSAAELAYTGRGVMTGGLAASSAALASGASVLEGSRAVVEAAKFGHDTALERGGGLAGASTGALSGAGLLVREGVRTAVPNLTSRRNSTASRITERRAIGRFTMAGYTVAEPSARSIPPSPTISNDSSGSVQ